MEPIHVRLLTSFILAYKGSRRLQKDGDETFSKDTTFDAVCTKTTENIGQRRIQCANLAGLEHMCGTNMDLSKIEFDSPRSASHLAPIAKVFLPWTSRGICRNSGKLQNISMKGSCSFLCSTTLDGQRKATQKPVCTTPKTWQHSRPSWGVRQK